MSALLIAAGGLQGTGAWRSTPVVMLVLLSALSLLPFLLLLTTSFVKIAVVLAILRSALGAAQIPPSSIITGLALILTLVVMAPTGERMLRAAEPELVKARPDGSLLTVQGASLLIAAAAKAREPLRDFLLRQTGQRERVTFFSLALHGQPPSQQSTVTDRDFVVLVPAFVASELRRAFHIGLLLFLPFLIIDLVMTSLLVALGMHGLSPTSVSLPFKLLLFVLADGWQLVMRGLLQSYG